MAGEMAAFNMSGNDPATYPDTPFQVLSVNGPDLQVVDGGLEATGSNSFTVTAGTPLYVPIFGLTDIPPFLAAFPTSTSEPRCGVRARRRRCRHAFIGPSASGPTW